MIDVDNHTIDTFKMPLLPIAPYEESEYFSLSMEQVTAWRQELVAFWSERG